jgi:hypothetical protein
LLRHGADPHRTTQKGKTALSKAVGRCNISAITRLVKLGCRASGSELRVPITAGDVATVRTLIRAGADVNETKRGKYGLPELAPLDIAIQERLSSLSDDEVFAGRGARASGNKSQIGGRSQKVSTDNQRPRCGWR